MGELLKTASNRYFNDFSGNWLLAIDSWAFFQWHSPTTQTCKQERQTDDQPTGRPILPDQGELKSSQMSLFSLSWDVADVFPINCR